MLVGAFVLLALTGPAGLGVWRPIGTGAPGPVPAHGPMTAA